MAFDYNCFLRLPWPGGEPGAFGLFFLSSLTSCTLDHLATVSLLTVIILNKVAMPPKCFFDRQRGQLRHHRIEKFSPFKGALFLKKHVLNWNWGAMFVQVSMSRTVSAKRGFKMSMTWSGLATKPFSPTSEAFTSFHRVEGLHCEENFKICPSQEKKKHFKSKLLILQNSEYTLES